MKNNVINFENNMIEIYLPINMEPMVFLNDTLEKYNFHVMELNYKFIQHFVIIHNSQTLPYIIGKYNDPIVDFTKEDLINYFPIVKVNG